jgi:hypothetical protein
MTLYQTLSNENFSDQQYKRLQKVFSENYYVLSFSNEDEKIIIDISGSTQSVYNITINKNSGKIGCNCPDSKSYASRYKCMCKHCCFTIVKIGKLIFNKENWHTLCLNKEEINIILQRLQKTTTIQNNNLKSEEKSEEKDDIDSIVNLELNMKYLSLKSGKTTTSKTCFEQFEKELSDDDECPICFDILKDSDIKNCPTCKNYIHTACIQKWLQTKSTCVLCRSTEWSKYFKTTKDNNSEYIKL